MSDRKIKLTIDGFGRPKIEAEGFTGETCKNATAALEKALSGGRAGGVSTSLKNEFYAVEPGSVEQEHQY